MNPTTLIPITSTMRIITVFALAGLSLAQEWCVDISGSTPSHYHCLQTAVKNAPNFAENFAMFMCSYKGKIPHKEESFKASLKEIILILKCCGCSVETIFDIHKDQTLEDALTAANKTLDEVVPQMSAMLDHLNLSNDVTDVLCTMSDVSLMPHKLSKVMCSINYDFITSAEVVELSKQRDSITSTQMVELSKNAGCFGNNVVNTEDTMEKLTKEVGPSLKHLAGKFLDEFKEFFKPGDTLADLICKLGLWT
ncbi:uncharacterized protein [Engystomops pustulosus]|uniref:uncharacterized protein isoform X2 n=1 Tax=Engystomops pustulosus TaxID=76066 RepID=UPI003AFB552D